MTRRSRLLAACGIVVAMLDGGSAALAQLMLGTAVAEVIRRSLVAPGSWLMNWPDGSVNPATGNAINPVTGNAVLTFEMQGQALVVKIQNLTANAGCERPAAIAGDVLSFDGCLETGISLRFTPDDAVFSFRGSSGRRWYALKPFRP